MAPPSLCRIASAGVERGHEEVSGPLYRSSLPPHVELLFFLLVSVLKCEAVMWCVVCAGQ